MARSRRNILIILLSAVAVIFLIAADPPKKDQQPEQINNCVECHTNAGKLISLLKKKPNPESSEEAGGCAVAPSRSEFLKYFVKRDFTESRHGSFGCTQCHGGDLAAEQAQIAHIDMRDAEQNCANCHSEIVQRYATSLHSTLAGQDHMLRLRAKSETNFQDLEPVRQNDCNTCHAGCSDCHITIPKAVGGGLISGHSFYKTPPMKETCAVCHGSRAGGEYLGTIGEDIPSDVHFKASMSCIDCHKEPLHGDGHAYESRWQVAGLPDCTNCHSSLPNDKTPAHQLVTHERVSCQVCHSVDYKNCFSCHASMDEKGDYHRVPQEKTIDFKIGRNTVPGYRYNTVPLRHNPVSRNAFDNFGKNLLPGFDEYPTWKTAAPHNIQRVTPQNQSCESCHGSDRLFLQSKDLKTKDSNVNKSVILERAPKY